MKKLLMFALLTGLFISCTSSPDQGKKDAAAKEKAAEHIAVVEKYLAAFESGDFESWREICTDDFKSYGPKYDNEATLDEYIESMKSYDENADSLNLETIAILAHTVEEGDIAGDWVFWWGVNSAYFTKIGKSAKLRIHTVFKMKDGKIEWEYDYWDTGDLKMQLSSVEEMKKKEKK